MATTDKIRKILWGRSGNQCAECRHDLVVNATLAGTASVVGDEFHIVSGKGQGPRYDPHFPIDRLDEPDNLILLCRVHHKRVDDQQEIYTADKLRNLKINHEEWVSSKLTKEAPASELEVDCDGEVRTFVLGGEDVPEQRPIHVDVIRQAQRWSVQVAGRTRFSGVTVAPRPANSRVALSVGAGHTLEAAFSLAPSKR